jgi:hypothetical protein
MPKPDLIANVRVAIRYVRHAAEQLPKIDRWATLLGHICQRIVGQVAFPDPAFGDRQIGLYVLL